MRTSPRSGGRVLDCVADEVAQRLCEPVGVGAQRARGNRTELEAARREQAHPIPQLLHEERQIDRLDAQELRLLGLGQQQQIVHEPADPRDLSLHQALDAAHLLDRGVGLGREHLELTADHRQRRAQLMRGVGDERALRRRTRR